ncbi:MAG: copper resistance protein B [Methylococcaceae bacterium]
MKISCRSCLMTALVVLNVSLSWAQDMPINVDHKKQQESDNKRDKKRIPVAETPVMDMGDMPSMDHSKMNHGAMSGMDHSKMNHDAMPSMDHSKMNHGAMSGMDHSKMNHDAMPSMDHSKMNDATHNAAHTMEHGSSDVMDMQSGSAPLDARDPHAHSDGYAFGSLEHDPMGDEEKLGSVLVDRLESVTTRSGTAMTYDWQAWYGKTYDRVLIRAEGEIDAGQFKDARNELLWAHAISPYWDTQLGVRYDSGKGTDRGWVAFGVQGLTPYWVYVEATAYVNEQGHGAFRLETEYDLLLTQKLIMQPRIETNFYSHRDDTREVSSGLSSIEAGLRLRYEIKRELAPYIGVEWASRFGALAQHAQMTGNNADELRFVAGVHVWF